MGATTTLLRTDDGRLLVRSTEGRRLGWHDLASGATHLSDSAAAGPVAEAVARYVARSSPLRDRRVTGLVPVQRAASSPPVRLDRPAAADLRDRPAGGSRRRALLAQLQDPPRPSRRRPFARRATGPVEELLADVRAALLVAHVLGEAPGLLGAGRAVRGPGTWTVLHDLPLAAGRVLDHLLVGPGGVVVVASAARPGAPVPGESWFEPLDSPAGSAVPTGGSAGAEPHAVVLERVRLVRSLLAASGHGRVRVHGVVVTTGRARRAPTGPAPSTVRVQDLPGWLRALPRVVSTVDAGRVAEVLAAPSTWPAADGSDQAVAATAG